MTRKDRLQQLIDSRAEGNQAAFAGMVHRTPPVIWQYLSGHREMGEKFARHIERCLRLPTGWMDQANDTPASAANDPAADAPSHPLSPAALIDDLLVVTGTVSADARDDLLLLLTRYIKTDDQDRKEKIARMLNDLSPAVPHRRPGASISKASSCPPHRRRWDEVYARETAAAHDAEQAILKARQARDLDRD
jgi:hypothetical protein